MKLLVTGICGFVGKAIASEVRREAEGVEIFGMDNLSRAGSEVNRGGLGKEGIRFVHGDIRNAADLEGLPQVDWVIDAAANPSVLAGVSGGTSSRQLMEHNLGGTLNLLEFCKRHRAGLVILSTSRVYSLERLCALPVEVKGGAFAPRFAEIQERGLSANGVGEGFSTAAPISLYGAAKLASEITSLEYGRAFDFPVQINRCGVLAGAGQFGKADQGIFSFWIHSYRQRRALKYIGFGGTGHQVRDCLHPRDLARLVLQQMRSGKLTREIVNISGGIKNSMSLLQLSEWCAARFGPHEVGADRAPRKYDVPWLVLDSARAQEEWGWQPETGIESVLEEIAEHAAAHPEWIEISNGP